MNSLSDSVDEIAGVFEQEEILCDLTKNKPDMTRIETGELCRMKCEVDMHRSPSVRASLFPPT